jgi:RHS repeat-associated protein
VSQYTTGYGHDIAGRLDRVWHHPALTNGVPQGTPTFNYGYTFYYSYSAYQNRPIRVGATTGQSLQQDFMPYVVTRNAVGGNPALTAIRIYEGTRDALAEIVNKSGTTSVSGYIYGVNSIGQRTNVQTYGTAFAGIPADISWDYDSLGQVTLADHATQAIVDRAYEYDPIGNRKKYAHGTTVLPANDNYSANTLNQYTLVPNYTPQPVHDLDGNLTRGPVPGINGNGPGVQAPADATLIEWDAENRMTSCKINADTFFYEYDHLSRLITRRVNTTISRRYHYDGWNRIAEFTDTALNDTFTWGLDLSGTMQGAGGVGGLLATRWVSSGNTDYFPTYDGNGNVSEYLTNSGVVSVHYEYDPFGTLTRRSGSPSNRFQYRFSTKPRDINTGLYYYGYRWYDPLTGRWPSRDPIEEKGGVNLYGFVGNDGICKWDRLGNHYEGIWVIRVKYKLDVFCVGCCLSHGIWSLTSEKCREIYRNVNRYGMTYTKDYMGHGTDDDVGFSAELNAQEDAGQQALNEDQIPLCYKYDDVEDRYSDSWWVPDPEA